jgi:hypothetical protein
MPRSSEEDEVPTVVTAPPRTVSPQSEERAPAVPEPSKPAKKAKKK